MVIYAELERIRIYIISLVEVRYILMVTDTAYWDLRVYACTPEFSNILSVDNKVTVKASPTHWLIVYKG